MGNKQKYRSLRGMPDILPEEAKLFRWVEDSAREVFRRFSYGEIRTPLLEVTEVFTRSLGEDTDIVGKEMYSFLDRGKKNISLRPEGTASVIRAFIENFTNENNIPLKLFYIGPMFRGERPQKGRLRQFHQIGAEIIGGSDPYIDADLILSLDMLLKEIGIDDFSILINSLGCVGDRANYKKALFDFLRGKRQELCEDCNRRVDGNVLRVLDCKKENCKKQVQGVPGILGYLCSDCKDAYTVLKRILSDMNVPFVEKNDLVRGLDYYTGTIFELTHPLLGSQDAIAAGGRYDTLTLEMGGSNAGATGYAIGIERLLLVIDKKNVPTELPEILVIVMDKQFRDEALLIVDKLRKGGVPCEMELTGRSFKSQMRRANRESRKYVLLLGEDEIKEKKVMIKDMETGEQEALPEVEVLEFFKNIGY